MGRRRKHVDNDGDSSEEDNATDRLKLFDSDGDASDEDPSKIEIDHKFVKRYEHNKQREELDRYNALKRQGKVDSSGSDSEESSEEEDLIKGSKKADVEFFEALNKIKNRDPILREKDAKLFSSDDEDEDEDEDDDGDADEDNVSKKEEKKKTKPRYLKDVISEQLIAAGPELSDEDESGDEYGAKTRVKTYSEEQEEKRQKLLRSLEEGENDDGGEDLLRLKSSGKEEEDDEDDEVFVEKVVEFFGEDEKLDDDNLFLKQYFEKRKWLDQGKSEDGGDVDVDLSEDEEAVEDQEDYERMCNFRHEENPSDRVMGHSRKVEGSVRKKDNARKSQRERKEERRVQMEFEKKEELKRMKNLKKKEINEKLEKVREVAGIGKDKGVFLDTDDLEEEFDPESHDRKMKEAFGEDYYGAEDVDPKFGSDEDEDEEELEKPDFDKEDELLGLSKGWDEVDKSGKGFKSARAQIMKGRFDSDDEDVVEEDVGNERNKGSKRKRKRKQSDVEKAVVEELLDEYYKLDYEDTIGDLKTRFKYRPVKAKKFGLNAAEILALDDKELNQYVSLKKIAPYREKEWEVPRIKTIQFKESIYKKGNTSRPVDEVKKGRHQDGEEKEEEVNAVESENLQPKESNGDKETISRKKRRKEKQAELKIPDQRKMAYAVGSEKSQPKESNGDKEIISRKRRRKNNQAELKPSVGRLKAYEKIPSKKSKKQK